MRRKRLHLLKPLAVLVVVALIAYVSITTWRFFHRPLFHNTFAAHIERKVLLPEWWPFPMPIVDRAGNLVLLDEPTNLVVVIPTGSGSYQGQRMPQSTAAGMVLELTTEPPRSVLVPTSPNHLFICDLTGKVVLEESLREGAARRLFDSIDTDTADAATLLREKLPVILKTPG